MLQTEGLKFTQIVSTNFFTKYFLILKVCFAYMIY